MISEAGPSFVVLLWNYPSLVESSLSRFEVTVHDNRRNESSVFVVLATTEQDFSFVVTDLDLSGSYEFVTSAVSEAGGIVGQSQPSNRVYYSGTTTCD